jgi:cobalt-zinc-cadmium efflux system membrane fusion protein
MATAFFLSCNTKKQLQEEQAEDENESITLTEEQLTNAAVKTDTIRKHKLNSELLVNGLIDVPPQNIVSVSFPLGGYLKNTRLLPGMQVKRGEVIAVMEDPALVQLQQDYLMAKARLVFLEKEYERQKLLREENVNAEKTYQQVQAEYSSQKVLVKGYYEKLQLIRINPDKLNENNISRSVPVYSPINGFVSKVNVNIGKYVNPADVLFELINPDDMHATLTVFEKDIAKVKPGQRVWVTFVDEPGVDYECDVLLVTRNVDDNRSALVHCHFERQPERLLPGMFLNARIQVSNAEVWAVPGTALVRYGNQDFLVEANTKNKFSLLPVTAGIKDGDLTEVKCATELAGKNIVVTNAYTVLSAMKNKADEDHH